MDSNPTELVLFAALAAGAFATINGLVGLAILAVKALIKKRNGGNTAPSPAGPNSTPFSSADRLILEQTHKSVEESFSQRRRISDAIKDGFHEMSGTMAESLSEDQKQTAILETLVAEMRRLEHPTRGTG